MWSQVNSDDGGGGGGDGGGGGGGGVEDIADSSYCDNDMMSASQFSTYELGAYCSVACLILRDVFSFEYILVPLDTCGLDTHDWTVLGGAFKNMVVANSALDPHLEHGTCYIDRCSVERLKNRTVD